MLYSYTVTNSGERRLKVPGVPYCSVTSLSENRVVILIGWLSKHSYNYTFKLLREILAGLSFDIHRIACLRRVSVNFKFLSILSQTAKWTFPVLVVSRKYDLLIKLNYESRNNSESLLEPLCCFAFWDRLL